ncbi:hypothetical protein PVAP13_1KG112283 [Panicum virgatum]|uniref:Uncharacterized protein n=1 Tax=Panicum virgatum TaxID=38727 RepID=A0A8T0Y3N6_PANVG|nr:hypothetical protein PVAP13_1KG112283 [Panicum virgatum]
MFQCWRSHAALLAAGLISRLSWPLALSCWLLCRWDLHRRRSPLLLGPCSGGAAAFGSSAAASPISCATATVTSAAVAAAAVFTFSPALNPLSFSPPSPPLFLLRAPYFSSPFRLLRSPAAAAASQPSPLHPFHRRLWRLVRRSPPPPHHRPAAAFPGPHTASPPGPGNPRARVLITATSLSLSLCPAL